MRHGNLFGIFAILLWSTLASLGVLVNTVPPFQLIAMTFFIGLFMWKKENKGILIHLKLPLKVWIIGVCGLFGNLFLLSCHQKCPSNRGKSHQLSLATFHCFI